MIEVLKQALEALEATMATHGFAKYINEAKEEAIKSLRQAIADLEKQERNFCPRCGKRLGKNDWDIHTCTPPKE
jgi:NADH pyrophosphatase NudC (nudix superfamily)